MITCMDHLPALNTGHLLTMTDDTGILQHAIFSVPNTREGYTTDDNARALIVSILLDENPEYSDRREYSNLSHRYLSFLWLAFHSDSGRFRNFLDYDRKWLENLARTIAMAAHCGRLEQVLGNLAKCWIERRGGQAFRSSCSCNTHFYQSACLGL